MKRIAVLTSGGDAPGMNAALRAIVRYGLYKGLQITGVKGGYSGLVNGDVMDMDVRSVSGILHWGGTVLKSSRCPEFRTVQGRASAIVTLRREGIDGLITIGGNGTTTGAAALASEWEGPIVGVPSTIDNDLYGTDYTIGFDTAVSVALEAIDRLRDTAASHNRIFFIEVMGRDAGFVALLSGLAGGAEGILVPEVDESLATLCQTLVVGRERGKSSSIVVVAEGEQAGGAFQLAARVKELTGLDYRVCVLGHVQRGGSPTHNDRIRASRYGAWAVQALLDGRRNVVVGEINGCQVYTPLEEACCRKKPFDMGLLELARVLAT